MGKRSEELKAARYAIDYAEWQMAGMRGSLEQVADYAVDATQALLEARTLVNAIELVRGRHDDTIGTLIQHARCRIVDAENLVDLIPPIGNPEVYGYGEDA